MKVDQLVPVLALVLSAACGPGPVGSLVLKASGEAGAVEGFPFTEDGETVALADGWEVRFFKALATIRHVDLGSADGQRALHDMDGFVVDLHEAESIELATFTDLPAGRWESFSFQLAPAVAASRRVGSVSQADLDTLAAASASLLLEGTATKGDAGLSFRWVLPVHAAYTDCTNGNDGKQGIVIAANTVAEAQVTLHLDHLFWTSLGSESSVLMFGAIAGKARDGAIAFDDLGAQSLSQPLDAAGQPVKDPAGNNLVYNPGSAAPAPANLREFILESASRMGHLNGTGLCRVVKQ